MLAELLQEPFGTIFAVGIACVFTVLLSLRIICNFILFIKGGEDDKEYLLLNTIIIIFMLAFFAGYGYVLLDTMGTEKIEDLEDY